MVCGLKELHGDVKRHVDLVRVEVLEHGEKYRVPHVGEDDLRGPALPHLPRQHRFEVRTAHAENFVGVNGAALHHEGDVVEHLVVHESLEVRHQGRGRDLARHEVEAEVELDEVVQPV
eukprot:CAMPEP_0185798720 /NCGR_PEP_ID=MMETSP1174-20130828/162298_1 /TAXON_ID=35687 /ORGANISM="Dictyocha speculum, Strain CCMP1381" /LENGTH=117 /DNA_ID=CAMNT_0028494233 /DNA_START=350 /DNA_END=703 /DNA_ORIENTATION=+